MTYTNRELVANLSANLGEIYTESFLLPDYNMDRVKWKTELTNDNQIRVTDIALGPIPFNLTIYKGAKAWKLPREFVQFLLTHPVANEFLGKLMVNPNSIRRHLCCFGPVLKLYLIFQKSLVVFIDVCF